LTAVIYLILKLWKRRESRLANVIITSLGIGFSKLLVLSLTQHRHQVSCNTYQFVPCVSL
jgi:hypothetical protein